MFFNTTINEREREREKEITGYSEFIYIIYLNKVVEKSIQIERHSNSTSCHSEQNLNSN